MRKGKVNLLPTDTGSFLGYRAGCEVQTDVKEEKGKKWRIRSF